MSETPTTSTSSSRDNQSPVNRVIKRFGGRHLIFRTSMESGWRILPRSYALVSDFTGPVWFFYGLGQIWVTHKKFKRYDGWTARVPRFGGAKFVDLLSKLESDLIEFTHHCNENGIEGTVVLEPSLICLLYTSPSPRDRQKSRMPSSA